MAIGSSGNTTHFAKGRGHSHQRPREWLRQKNVTAEVFVFPGETLAQGQHMSGGTEGSRWVEELDEKAWWMESNSNQPTAGEETQDCVR